MPATRPAKRQKKERRRGEATDNAGELLTLPSPPIGDDIRRAASRPPFTFIAGNAVYGKQSPAVTGPPYPSMPWQPLPAPRVAASVFVVVGELLAVALCVVAAVTVAGWVAAGS